MRRYNIWGGNPKGTPEDPTRCIAKVSDSNSRSPLSYQCWHKRGKGKDGLFCGIHAKRVLTEGWDYPEDKP